MVHSEETKKKIRESNKKWWEEHPEQKKKLSENRKGKNNPNYGGKSCTEETKKKLSKAGKGRHIREETKNKIRKAAIKRYKDPKERKKQSKRSRKYWRDPEYREKHTGKNHPMYGKKSEECPFYNHHHTEKAKQKIKEKALKHWKDPKYRNKLIKIRRELWRNPIYRNKVIQKIAEGLDKKPNKPETILNTILQNNFPDQWEYVGDGKIIIGGLIPDFIHNRRKLIIEMFGDYWHDDKQRDLQWHQTEWGRKAYFSRYNYRTLIIWEHELNNKNNIIMKISNFFKL